MLAERVRWIMGAPRRKRHPELSELHAESDRIKQVVRRLVNDSSNCIDVGCHIGSMLDIFVKLAPNGRHMAFEPIPWKAQWLVRKYPRVQVRQMALCDTTGEMEFSIDLAQSGYSGLVTSHARDGRTQVMKVPCEQLDRLVPADHKVDFLKVDVEGAELMVFRGAKELLLRDQPPIIFESTKSNLNMFGQRPADMFDHLVGGHGYSLFTPRGFLEGSPPLDSQQFDSAHSYPFQAFNFIAMPWNRSPSSR
jgi:FkbM family methyltransferase